mgnify:CR=1 FL=1|tara:strand:+ start:6645 stop:6968 length:324 start_codon:yes stop_codon:yes gene_type:complete
MSDFSFISIVGTDPVSSMELGVVQESVRSNIEILRSIPFLDGVHKTGIDLVSGDNNIGHGLGRNYIGMIITNIDAARTLYINATNTSKAEIIIVNSSGISTADLWIF